jgi:pyridoxal phosphate enzyme (YggS family)
VGLADNLARVRKRIARAAERASRIPDAVTLVAVTKGQPVATVRALWELGLRDFGENRVQEALTKVDALPEPRRWHLIGHLQVNKINKVLPWAHMIQSVDSLELARALSQRAERRGVTLPVLLEVKTSSEATKHGFDPHAAEDAWGEVASLPCVEPRGLMTIAPFTQEESELRRSFRTLRHLHDRLQSVQPAPSILSMGMSDDLEIAIEEGSNMVRVGRALVAP